MNNLTAQIQDVLDMSFSLEILYFEANKKLIDTIMLLNGLTLVRIKDFMWSDNKVFCHYPSPTTGEIMEAFLEVKTLEAILPDTGYYRTKKGYIYLLKIPKKHWAKSFSLGAYQIHTINSNSEIEMVNFKDIMSVVDFNTKHIIVNVNRDIFYNETVIGYVYNSNTIVCTNKLYQQELRDWIRDEN